MNSFQQFLQRRLQKRNEDGLLRKLTTQAGLIDFSSNDYLGLARSNELFLRIKQNLETLPLHINGATGSRLLSGNWPYYEEVEKKLSSIFRTESALIFNSGYAANQAALSSIPQKNDLILYDELAHACIKDGARLSLARKYPFRHNDLNDLEKKIKNWSGGRIYVAVESVYSMDGDECPLVELVKLTQAHDASIILDEAHSTGVTGKQGAGLAEHLGVAKNIEVRIHTFGKAMGVHGACVVGSTNLIDYLINYARPFIYTTALPLHSIVSIECAFQYLEEHSALQTSLQSRIKYFVQGIKFSNRTKSTSAIQTVIIPGNENVKKTAHQLQLQQWDVRPILSPTVQKNSERLRICLHSFNTEEEIKNLIKAVEKYC